MSNRGTKHIDKQKLKAVCTVGCASILSLVLTAGIPASKQEDLKEEARFIGGTMFVLDNASKDNAIITASILPAVMQHPVANTQATVSLATEVMKECEPFKPKVSMVAHNVPVVGSAQVITDTILTEEDFNTVELSYGPNEASVIDVAKIEPTDEPVKNLTDNVADVYEIKAKGLPADLQVSNGQVLLKSVAVDPNYEGQVLHLTGANRDNFERLVMGEAGDEGYEGAALVAQALKDTMIMTGNTDTLSIKKQWGYSGRLGTAPNSDVKRACQFILDEGGSAVQHRIIYFYAPKYVRGGVSRFHETQEFVIEHRGHRVFDMR